MKLFSCVICMFLCILKNVEVRELLWTCNTNADNRENWIGGDYMKNCKGFYFPSDFNNICIMSLKKLTTNIIYFPIQGDIELRDNTEIIFSENSETCVKIRDDLEVKSMADPQCWKNDNKATPDAERVPCYGDNIIIPDDSSYNIEQSPFRLKAGFETVKGEVGSLWSLFVKNKLDSHGCSKFIIHDYSSLIQDHYFHGFREDTNAYRDNCRIASEISIICSIREFWRPILCSNPIDVFGHCTGFCGSVMQIKGKDNFDMKEFVKNFGTKENIDIYYTIIKLKPTKVYQITLTDKNNFTGQSVDYAKAFYDKITSDDLYAWNITEVRANFSGYRIDNVNRLGNILGILFGTFLLVVLIFGLVFAFYVGPLRNTNIKIPNISSLRNVRESLAKSRKQFVFAKFENKDDGTVSMGGSVISLDKAFDNPMYGQQMASTSTASIMEPVDEGEEINEVMLKPKSESTFSNPLYDKETIMDLSEE